MGILDTSIAEKEGASEPPLGDTQALLPIHHTSGEGLNISAYDRAIEGLSAYLEKARNDPEQRILYEQQVPIMEDLYRFLVEQRTDPRGYVSLPTGVGKTVLFTEFIKATGLRTLVLTPTKLLLKQTEQAFGKFSGDEEIAVGKVFAHEKEEGRITITTYASFVRHAKDKDSTFLDPREYDLMILDEAHRALGEETRQALATYPLGLRIGLTATENYSQKKRLETLLPCEIHKMRITEAVSLELISPFSVWLVQTDTDMSKVRITTTDEYDQADLQRTLNTEARNQVAAELYIKYFAGQKAIFACSGVEHAKAMAALLVSCGVPAAAIYGKLSMNEQMQLKAAFADPNSNTGLMILCNDKILAEGFDEPSIQAAFNLAPTLSAVRCQQRSGRALRLDPNRLDKHATIIEFIDRNYVKPPVIFADDNIAGSAHIGSIRESSVNDHTYTFNLATAEVITCSDRVEETARSFAEGRKDARPLPPDGWLTFKGLSREYNVASTVVRFALEDIERNDAEFLKGRSGSYRATNTRGLMRYYSPDIIPKLRDHILEPSVVPPGWLSAGQISQRYSTTAVGLHTRLKTMAGDNPLLMGVFAKFKGSRGKHHFFSPDLVRQYAKSKRLEYVEPNQIPPGWKDEITLFQEYGQNTTTAALRYLESAEKGKVFRGVVILDAVRAYSPEIERTVARLVAPPKGWVSIYSLASGLGIDVSTISKFISDEAIQSPYKYERNHKLCWVDGRETPYVTRYFADILTKKVGEIGEVTVSTGTTLVEDEVVLIPHFEQSRLGALPNDRQIQSVAFESVVNPTPKKHRRKPLTRPRPDIDKYDGLANAQYQEPANPPRRTNMSYLEAMRRFKSS